MFDKLDQILGKVFRDIEGLSRQQQKLIAELMANGSSFENAATAAGVDPAGIDVPAFAEIFEALPPGLQARFAEGGIALPPALHQAVFGSPATGMNGTGGSTAANSAAGFTTGQATGTGAVTNPAGHAPPGLNRAEASLPPPIDPGIRILPGLVQTVANAPSALIQRLFNGEGARAETPLTPSSAVPRATAGDTLRTDTTQVVTMPRNGNGEAHRAERAQQNPAANTPNAQAGYSGHPANFNGLAHRAERAVQNALARPDVQRGTGEAAQRQDALPNAANAARAQGDGRAPGAPASALAAPHAASAQAAPQGAASAAGYAAQQAQAAPQQAGARQMGDTPQHAARAAEAAVSGQRIQDARPALAPADARGFNPPQSPLPGQAVQPTHARPEAMAAQVMPQLAGLTVMATPQLPAVNAQLGQNAMPVASGAENAASQTRDALLAPAGHTLAGFLRRDHRGRGQALLRRPVDWALAMMPGARKRRAEGEPQATSFQWLFWILTVTAYGALATAVVIMIPHGGRLIDGNGTPSTGAYALAVAGIAAIASWFASRRMAKPSP